MTVLTRPRLVKRPCLKQQRTFEQLSFAGDPFEVLEYLLSLRQTGTIHLHISQGHCSLVEWRTARSTDRP